MSQNNRERLRASQEASAKQRRLNRIIGVAAAILAVVLVGVFAVVLLQNQSHQTTASSVTPPNATSDAKSVVVNPGKAAGGAPVVELFFDYQCPVCKQFETCLLYTSTEHDRLEGQDAEHRPTHRVGRRQPHESASAARTSSARASPAAYTEPAIRTPAPGPASSASWTAASMAWLIV